MSAIFYWQEKFGDAFENFSDEKCNFVISIKFLILTLDIWVRVI